LKLKQEKKKDYKRTNKDKGHIIHVFFIPETLRHHKTMSDTVLLDLFNFLDIWKNSQDKFV